MIEEAKAVQRWTGVVDAHEGGGFVAVGDYMALEQSLKRIEQKADVLIAERNQLRAEVERLSVSAKSNAEAAVEAEAEVERLKESNTRLRAENSSHAEHMGRESAALRKEIERLKQEQAEAEETISILNGELCMFYKPKQEQAEPVASIYIKDDEREFDDWKHPLPQGRNLLYTAPQGQTALREQIGNQAINMMEAHKLLRQALEALECLQPSALTSIYTISAREKAITAIKQHLGEA